MGTSDEGDIQPSLVIRKAKDRLLAGFDSDSSSSKWSSPFYFVQAADTQLGMVANYGDGTIADQYPNVTWDREVELCRQTVTVLNSMRPKPAFFIVCGDLVDAFPDKWPQLRAAQERDFFNVFKDLDPDIPLVCVCGNHDVGNRPTRETIAGYTSTWGDDYFSFWKNGVHFIVLNSQFYEDSSLTQDLAGEQEKWLDQQLALSKGGISKHTVVFQHIPWFINDPEEDKEYFNIEFGLRKTMLDKFYDAGVRKIFCGHYHRNAGGWYKDLEVVVTSAIGCQLGNDPHGMRIVRVDEKSITHKYHGLDDCPNKFEL